jgi:hypothetical protein
MKAMLRGEVPLLDLSVLAEVAVWERRPEFQRLLASASPSGVLTESLAESALPGLTPSAYRNLLTTLTHLKLIGPTGGLTAFGQVCVSTGESPAWELGAYTFLVARHPCSGVQVLGFRREKADGLDQRYSDLGQIPSWFQPSADYIWSSAFGDGGRFAIAKILGHNNLPPQCRIHSGSTAELEWSLDLDSGANSFVIRGTVGGGSGAASIAFETAPAKVPEDEVLRYFAQWEPRWDPRNRRVMITYDNVGKDSGLDGFTRDLSYKKVQAGPRGEFQDVEVQAVPVAPVSTAEANRWAQTLALARVSNNDQFISPARWKALWDAVVTGTPLQGNCEPAPDADSLVNQSNMFNTRLRWLLAAGADLSME